MSKTVASFLVNFAVAAGLLYVFRTVLWPFALALVLAILIMSLSDRVVRLMPKARPWMVFAVTAVIVGSVIVFSMAVVIGFLMLMGIVTKNAIMLVEFAVSAMDRGVAKREAILDAVHKRARPIVMTTIAMTAGMVPSALGTGDGAEFSAPMAIAVIGGLLLSTLLSLLFVPSLFSLVYATQVRLGGGLARWIGLNAGRRRAPGE